ncbi:hypothetical protein LB503_001369 [Fusarium chuoi]|nr:hypothetical protein LB503_001369 [Fusarium chuoi]
MRLINTKTLELQEFFNKNTPPYAILSHAWGDQEVTFQEWQNCQKDSSKTGYLKILKACKEALKHKLDWLWVNTNCIDKSSSAELSEAINSMFAYYRNSRFCFAYLADVTASSESRRNSQIKNSRWFTRGWTLQELLAPRRLIFYDADWREIGWKNESMSSLIATITSIDTEYLDRTTSIRDAPVATRMSWLGKRSTTRKEDMAYCMPGIFDTSMPLLYGEGKRAFLRLQEEIIKSSKDHTIFCWGWNEDVPTNWASLLAPWPTVFEGAGDFKTIEKKDDISVFSMTNAGLSIRLPAVPTLPPNGRDGSWFIMLQAASAYTEDQRNDARSGTLEFFLTYDSSYMQVDWFCIASCGCNCFLSSAKGKIEVRFTFDGDPTSDDDASSNEETFSEYDTFSEYETFSVDETSGWAAVLLGETQGGHKLTQDEKNTILHQWKEEFKADDYTNSSLTCIGNPRIKLAMERVRDVTGFEELSVSKLQDKKVRKSMDVKGSQSGQSSSSNIFDMIFEKLLKPLWETLGDTAQNIWQDLKSIFKSGSTLTVADIFKNVGVDLLVGIIRAVRTSASFLFEVVLKIVSLFRSVFNTKLNIWVLTKLYKRRSSSPAFDSLAPSKQFHASFANLESGHRPEDPDRKSSAAWGGEHIATTIHRSVENNANISRFVRICRLGMVISSCAMPAYTAYDTFTTSKTWPTALDREGLGEGISIFQQFSPTVGLVGYIVTLGTSAVAVLHKTNPKRDNWAIGMRWALWLFQGSLNLIKLKAPKENKPHWCLGIAVVDIVGYSCVLYVEENQEETDTVAEALQRYLEDGWALGSYFNCLTRGGQPHLRIATIAAGGVMTVSNLVAAGANVIYYSNHIEDDDYTPPSWSNSLSGSLA